MHNMATPEEAVEQFRARYGQEPTPYFQDTAFWYLKYSMNHAWEANNFEASREGRVNRADSAVVGLFPDGPVKIDELIKPGWMDQDSWDYILERGRSSLGFNNSGSGDKPGPFHTRIVETLADKITEPFRREFTTVTRLLSDISGTDLTFLDQFLFRYRYDWLERMINSTDDNYFEVRERNKFRERHELSPEQIQLIHADTFVPPQLCNPDVHRTGFVTSFS